jgi:hypothetical protein
MLLTPGTPLDSVLITSLLDLTLLLVIYWVFICASRLMKPFFHREESDCSYLFDEQKSSSVQRSNVDRV